MPEVKKYRKKRQMTDEQKQAAALRLAAAREKRMQENPPEYKSIHPTVLKLDDEDTLSMKNVKAWIKTQKELASVYRREARNGIKGAEAKQIRAENYARNMQNYLSNGVWLDMFYGERGDKLIGQVCVHMAYYDNGEPKRSHGVFYPDINKIWGVDSDGKDCSTNAEIETA